MNLEAEADSSCMRQAVALLKQVTKALEMLFFVCPLCSYASDDTLKTYANCQLRALLFSGRRELHSSHVCNETCFLPSLKRCRLPRQCRVGREWHKCKTAFHLFLNRLQKGKKKTEVLSNESEKHDSSLLSLCQKNVSTTELLPPLSVLLPAFIMNLTGLHNEAIIDCSLPARQWN